MRPWVAQAAAIRTSNQGIGGSMVKIRLRLQKLFLLPKIPQLPPVDLARRMPTSRSKDQRMVSLLLCCLASPRRPRPRSRRMSTKDTSGSIGSPVLEQGGPKVQAVYLFFSKSFKCHADIYHYIYIIDIYIYIYKYINIVFYMYIYIYINNIYIYNLCLYTIVKCHIQCHSVASKGSPWKSFFPGQGKPCSMKLLVADMFRGALEPMSQNCVAEKFRGHWPCTACCWHMFAFGAATLWKITCRGDQKLVSDSNSWMQLERTW